MKIPFEEEPEVLDENDPEIKEEIFQTLKFMGTKPASIRDPFEAAEYAEWLERS